jgi:hypothetical protein
MGAIRIPDRAQAGDSSGDEEHQKYMLVVRLNAIAQRKRNYALYRWSNMLEGSQDQIDAAASCRQA